MTAWTPTAQAPIVAAPEVSAPREWGDEGGSAPPPAPATVLLALPSSDLFERDIMHARRGQVGGTLARSWFALTIGGVTVVRSFQHNGSRADPTGSAGVPALSGLAHRYIDLGAVAASASDVSDAVIASLALDSISAVAEGTDAEGRALVRITADSLTIPPAVDTTDTSLRGLWGAQRDDWGTSPPQNQPGGTNGTGSIHLGNPSSQPGLSGRNGRIIAVYMWAHTGHQPRLGVSSGPAYSASPGAMTLLAQAIATDPITDFGMATFDAVAFSSTDELWAHYRENAAGGPRYRPHGSTPVGRGDQGLNQVLVWDTTSAASSASAFGATYTPTVDATFNIYIMIGVVYELQDSNGNYHADGSIDTWIGDQNLDPLHGTRFDAGPALIDTETTHHRTIFPNWTNYGATEYRRAVGALGADEDSRAVIYGPWPDLDLPATTPPALIRDIGPVGLVANDYGSVAISPRAELGTEVLGSDPYVSVGANYVRDGGLANNVYTLPVFLDSFAGDGSWLNCWEDDGRTWHDHIPGAAGAARTPTSGVIEYRTTATPGMPTGAPEDTFPDPMATAAGNDSPVAIAMEALRVQRVGIASA